MDNQSLFSLEKLWDVLKHDAQNPLVFNTGLFLILFVIFVGLYQLMAKYKNVKMVFVILFSLYFYYKSSAEYCFVLLGVCLLDYLLGGFMGKTETPWKRRLIVGVNVLINVGMLAYFKYFNLLLETINSFSDARFDALDIILPAGISYFSFRSISYIVDLYRRQMEPCDNFLEYTFYLTFFPPLLMGPIVRAKDMLPQIKANPVASHAMVAEGLFLICAGLIKKVVVADYIGESFVQRVFDNPSMYSGFENLMGMYGFTLQLYCDFSGYTDMAIGIALLLGYRFLDNFRSPFKSQNPTEFWRRWHISLSTWLRDYVYIPLGGNRCSKARRDFNQMATMVVGGLWHGATWMYVLWGTAHGVLLIVHKRLKEIFPSLPDHKKGSWWRTAGNIFLTFNLVALIFVLFKAPDLDHVKQMFTQVFTNFHISIAPQFIKAYVMVVIIMLMGFFMHFTPARWTRQLKTRFTAAPLLLQALILALVIFLIIQTKQSDIVPFIYLQY